jgi:hypothetical protein
MCVLSSTSTHMTDTDMESDTTDVDTDNVNLEAGGGEDQEPDPDQQSTAQRIRQRHVRRHIQLPDGRVLIPRAEFAADLIGENERTTRRRKLPTVYIANVAYVDRDGSLEIVATEVRRKNQPAPTTPKPRSTSPAPRRAARSARRASDA